MTAVDCLRFLRKMDPSQRKAFGDAMIEWDAKGDNAALRDKVRIVLGDDWELVDEFNVIVKASGIHIPAYDTAYLMIKLRILNELDKTPKTPLYQVRTKRNPKLPRVNMLKRKRGRNEQYREVAKHVVKNINDDLFKEIVTLMK